jgi:excisionase family DNA binding protein
MPNPERLVTQREAADHADVHVRTIQRWIAIGVITGYRYGVGAKYVKVDLDEVDTLTRPVASR